MITVIIEDEKLAAERLESMLLEIEPGIEIAAKLKSVNESINWLKENKADLLFVDIQLSDGISFSIFDKVKIDTPVIFTTAYDQYAIKAFDLNSIDYLLKPIRKADLSDSIKKYKSIKKLLLPELSEILKSIQGREETYKKRFLLQYADKIKKVEIDEIAYFYSLEKNTLLATFEGKTYPVDQSLDSIQKQIDPDKFFRINRKMIINVNAIKNMIPFSRSRIKLEMKPDAPKNIDPLVSVERATEFKQWLSR